MTSKEQLKKLMSVGTNKKVNDLLFKLDHTESKKDLVLLQEKLRDLMGKLFPYKDIFEFHDDHILELAEIVADLYPEQANLEEYASNILVYINRNQERYRKRVFQYRTMFRQKRKELPVDSDEYLDLKYQTWTYTDGYYHQQALMYELIGRTLRLLIEQSRKGRRKTCQKTRKKT